MKVVFTRAKTDDRPNGGYRGDGVRTGEREKLRPQVTGWRRRKQDVLDIVLELLFECRKKDDACLERSAETSVTCEVWPANFSCSTTNFLCSFSRQTNLRIEIRDVREWKQVLGKAECMQTCHGRT